MNENDNIDLKRNLDLTGECFGRLTVLKRVDDYIGKKGNRIKIWEYNGEKHRVKEWAEILGINAHCLHHRRELGWTIEQTLTTPLRGRRNA